MFRGRFEHSLDDKGRIAIPSRFRDLLLENSSNPTIIITNFDRCIVAYALSDWEKLEAKLDQLPQLEANIAGFIRYFVSGATECPLDKAGRILIPANLREFAKIDRDCMIAGQLSKFEIWSASLWAQEFSGLSDQFVHITKAMNSHGIQI